jgi:hypothetical protein
VSLDGDAEALSITRLEGSGWRGGRLWSYKLGSPAGVCGERTIAAGAIEMATAMQRGDRLPYADPSMVDTRLIPAMRHTPTPACSGTSDALRSS